MAIDRSIGLQILEVLRDIKDALEQIAENTTPAEADSGDGTEDGSGAGAEET